MGVPVLTLRGDRPAGRLTSSVLTAMGLTEFITESNEELIAKARGLNAARLNEVRKLLRARLTATIGNAARYARALEAGCRDAWRTWCRAQPQQFALPGVSSWNAVHTRGCAVLEAGDADAAATLFREASALNPLAVPPRAMLAGILSDRCDLAGAAEQYALALKAGPDAKVRIAAALALPPIYESTDQIAECRATLVKRIDALHADGVRLDPLRGPIPNLFLAAYQGLNDRDLMRSYAKLFAPSPWSVEPLTHTPSGKVKVGLISQYFQNHTIGTLNRGLVEKLDRAKFHVTVFSAGKSDDETGRNYRQAADEFVELPGDTASAVRLIRGRRMDVVLFTDLGMSCVTLALAHARLAPRQAVTWGHPLTTGIPSVDDFISGDVYETADAHNHYTERLVTLKGLNTYYERPRLDRVYPRSEFQLPEGANLYGCPQTLFKFHPDFDEVLHGILDADPAGRLVLVEGRNKSWKERLLARWGRRLPQDRVHWIGTLPRPSFLGLCSVCDVMLDPLHFGGGNTSLEAIALGVPVVTLPSSYLRARLTAGFYQYIGMPELCLSDAKSYLALAVKLAVDEEYRRGIISQLQKRSPLLFEDLASVTAIEDYFLSPSGSRRLEPAANDPASSAAG